jgi:hypothetical protein
MATGMNSLTTKLSLRKNLLVQNLLLLQLLSVVAAFAAWTSGTGILGAVSSESRLCTEVGIELLERGVCYAQKIRFSSLIT